MVQFSYTVVKKEDHTLTVRMHKDTHKILTLAEMKSHLTTLVTHSVAHMDVVISSRRISMCRRELWTAQWTWTV